MNDGRVTLSYQQFTRESIEIVQSNMAVEVPVSLTVNGQVWLTFQCTPEDLGALAIGFLFNEGFIQTMGEVENIHICENKDNVDVWLNHSVHKPDSWRRTSGCHGGASSADLESDHFEPVTNPVVMNPEQIFTLVDHFLSEQLPHSEWGGVHTSALADGANQLFQIHDIGRHNTFDKISGRMLLQRIQVQIPILLTTGRISSDMVQKSIRMRSPMLISMRSASVLGVTLADQWGLSLISGARRGRFNLLCHPERVKFP